MGTPFSPHQLTLGDLTDLLRKRPPEQKVYFDFCDMTPGPIYSYRGYYDHLAFVPSSRHRAPTVASPCDSLTAAIGQAFVGYKGGNFVMGPDTPLWVSHNGENIGTVVAGIADCEHVTVITTAWVDT